jgi:hypothetical protein
MKIRCSCGEVIVDQTDYISNKARLIADQDWEDFLVGAGNTGKADWSLSRAIYQCGACGRLYVDDQDGNLRSFLPEENALNILSSVKKENWKRPLIGSWDDNRKPPYTKGYLWVWSTQPANNAFDDWNELEKAYFDEFRKLKELGHLRSALLRKNGEDKHVWLNAQQGASGDAKERRA